MNKSILILMLFFTIVKLQAQEYQISFAGKGASSKVDQVKVENLTQGTSIILSGTEILHLSATNTGIKPIQEIAGKTLRVYPCPMTEYCLIEFMATASGKTSLEIFDITGKRISQIQNTLASGIHTFKIRGLGCGIYLFKIYSHEYSYVGQLISNNITYTEPSITYQGSINNSNQSLTLKSAENVTVLPYAMGDMILFTGISDNYNTIVADRPTQSGTITFNFVACTDADGNNYPIVQIGTQTWMAENLKTTKYQNGDDIPNITDNNVWKDLTTGAFCDYNNETSSSNTFGHLYNWFAASDSRNIAPTGWHVPMDTEWTTLVNYLGADSISGEKLKETGTAHWDIPNANATNETGFTGLPAGLRNYNGPFALMGKVGYWWSASEADSFGAWLQTLMFDTGYAGLGYNGKKFGYSLRCLMNETPAQKNFFKINETEYELYQGGLMYYGNFEGHGVYNHDIMLFSPEININWNDTNASGIGAIIDFSIFNTKNKLDDGTYMLSIPEIEQTEKICDGIDWNADGEIDDMDCYHTLPEGKFYISSRLSLYGGNLDIATNYYDTAQFFESGNVVIHINEGKYTISFDCIGVNKDIIKGYFEGTLEYLDYSSGN